MALNPTRLAGAACACAVAVLAAACGAAPASPTLPSALAPPPNVGVLSQRVNFLSNDVELAWSGATASRYRVSIGSAPGASDVKVIETPGTAVTWTAPRTANVYYVRVASMDAGIAGAPSTEVTVTTIDLRDLIDALYFQSGPLSLGRAMQLGSIPAPVWPDGTRLRVLVSNEVGDDVRVKVQAAADAYAVAVGGTVTATVELVDEGWHSISSPTQLPPFTVAVRVQNGLCGLAAAACAFFGPPPAGVNASILTVHYTTVSGTVIAHEMGHVYGFQHIGAAPAGSPFRFAMNPASGGGDGLSPAELAAMAAAHAGGVRGGTTRDQALAAGLVLPWPR